MPTASKAKVRKAQCAESMKRVAGDLEFFRVLEVNPRYVLFFFGGYHIRFEVYQGRVVRMGGDQRYLSVDDYALMYKLADMLMNASLRAIKVNKKPKIKKTSIQPLQMSLLL